MVILALGVPRVKGLRAQLFAGNQGGTASRFVLGMEAAFCIHRLWRLLCGIESRR